MVLQFNDEFWIRKDLVEPGYAKGDTGQAQRDTYRVPQHYSATSKNLLRNPIAVLRGAASTAGAASTRVLRARGVQAVPFA